MPGLDGVRLRSGVFEDLHVSAGQSSQAHSFTCMYVLALIPEMY